MMGNEIELTKLEGVWGNPFVILGMPRTGSTLLLTSLQQHPDIWAHGELFHKDTVQRATRHAIKYTDGTVVYYDGESDPMAFLMRRVFSYEALMLRKARTVGFKLFMEQANNRLLHQLQHMGVRVIHIMRRNLFDVLVSRRLAEVTKAWEVKVGEVIRNGGVINPIEPFFLYPNEVRAQFEMMKKWNRDIFYLFGGSASSYLLVEYETLASTYQQCMDAVFNFLEVHSMTVKPETKKQGLPVSRMVRNYEMLRDHFMGSEYELFFQQPERRVNG